MIEICCCNAIGRHHVDQCTEGTDPDATVHKTLLHTGQADRFVQFHHPDCAQASDIGNLIQTAAGLQTLLEAS